MYQRLARAVTPDLTWSKIDAEWDGGVLVLIDVKTHAQLERFDYDAVDQTGDRAFRFTLQDALVAEVAYQGGCTCGGSPPPIPTEQVPA